MSLNLCEFNYTIGHWLELIEIFVHKKSNFACAKINDSTILQGIYYGIRLHIYI